MRVINLAVNFDTVCCLITPFPLLVSAFLMFSLANFVDLGLPFQTTHHLMYLCRLCSHLPPCILLGSIFHFRFSTASTLGLAAPVSDSNMFVCNSSWRCLHYSL